MVEAGVSPHYNGKLTRAVMSPPSSGQLGNITNNSISHLASITSEALKEHPRLGLNYSK